jgi:hypothetical protein
VYALLPNRQKLTYDRLFSLIRREIPSWSPKTFKIDFETAAIQSIPYTFPNAMLRGCNFHFNQCSWRQVQELGLVCLYRENEEVGEHVRKCAALAHTFRRN